LAQAILAQELRGSARGRGSIMPASDGAARAPLLAVVTLAKGSIKIFDAGILDHIIPGMIGQAGAEGNPCLELETAMAAIERKTGVKNLSFGQAAALLRELNMGEYARRFSRLTQRRRGMAHPDVQFVEQMQQALDMVGGNMLTEVVQRFVAGGCRKAAGGDGSAEVASEDGKADMDISSTGGEGVNDGAGMQTGGKLGKAGARGDNCFSDDGFDYAKAHEKIKGDPHSSWKDADLIYPGRKETLGYTEESAVQGLIGGLRERMRSLEEQWGTFLELEADFKEKKEEHLARELSSVEGHCERLVDGLMKRVAKLEEPQTVRKHQDGTGDLRHHQADKSRAQLDDPQACVDWQTKKAQQRRQAQAEPGGGLRDKDLEERLTPQEPHGSHGWLEAGRGWRAGQRGTQPWRAGAPGGHAGRA